MQARKLFRPGTLLSLLPLLVSATLFAQNDEQGYQSDPPASIARIGYLNGTSRSSPTAPTSGATLRSTTRW